MLDLVLAVILLPVPLRVAAPFRFNTRANRIYLGAFISETT